MFDPNRWPKPYPMLGATRRLVIGCPALVAVVVVLLVALPALAD